MDTPEQLAELLRTSGEEFRWAMEQVPHERWLATPPRHPEEWSAGRHAFHIAYYERRLALPSLRQWLDGAMANASGPAEDAAVEEAAWRDIRGSGANLAALLDDVRNVRDEQIAVLARMAPDALDETREAIWGQVTLRWVVTKSLQHTYEHTHDVLRMALWWDFKR